MNRGEPLPLPSPSSSPPPPSEYERELGYLTGRPSMSSTNSHSPMGRDMSRNSPSPNSQSTHGHINDEYNPYIVSSSPTTPDPNQPLLVNNAGRPFANRRQNTGGGSVSSGGIISSPLNPNTPRSGNPTPVTPSFQGTSGGQRSRTNSTHMNRIPSEEARALESMGAGSRGSMILWKLAGPNDSPSPYGGEFGGPGFPLTPPGEKRFSRFSVHSNSGDSLMSYSSDSKYPYTRPVSGFIAYAYDPLTDDHDGPKDEVDRLHEPDGGKDRRSTGINWRGIVNMSTIVLILLAIVLLFTAYPIISFFTRQQFAALITGNVQINSTGQFPDLPNLPSLIDKDTPLAAMTRKGYDGFDYELVFSDEFEKPNRTFYPGDDPFWEAVDLWYWATADMEWYSPTQVTTKDGKLVITMENKESHGLEYVSGMLQTWNKFCFTTGYIEASVSFPGLNSNAQGYWPGVWTMGNLGRPGYGSTNDGTWPYTYDSCDVGTFPNQTERDRSGPAAALHSDYGRSKYNYELSWLPGQKLSRCTCPGEDHPGPDQGGDMPYPGRSAPEIDVLEAQKNKLGYGGKVSQSTQFAPFNADYQAQWDSLTFHTTETARNAYNGSAVQQAISCLSTVPDNLYRGAGGDYGKFGFEYWSNPKARDEGFVNFVVDGKPSYSMVAAAVGADPLSQIGPRIVPEEPMAIILNLGMSQGFQTVDFTTLEFPAEFKIDYIRVYQRKGFRNLGCDPPEYPTMKYIENHINAYTNANLTTWAQAGYGFPKNRRYEGGC